MKVKVIRDLPEDFDTLLSESVEEGFEFLQKLKSEWDDKTNRFDLDGEFLLAVFKKKQCIGIGGLNLDPYLNDPMIGRVRHFYILREFRGKGAGKKLLQDIMRRSSFDRVRLRAMTEDAAKFYEKMGFEISNEENTTHAWRPLPIY